MFQNPGRDEIVALLKRARTIAVVGLSPNPARPSHSVSRAMQGFGYRILPVHPAIDEVLGEKVARSLDDVQRLLKPGEQIDIVDVFRSPEHVAGIVDDCIRLGFKAIWLQEGVINAEAAQKARDAGIFVVMDRCIYKDRASMR